MSMNRETDLLLQSGIAAVRSGDKREGARLLAQVVRKEPQSEDAWFWLAAATDQPAEAAACLRRVLAINPNNERARQALNMLDTGQGQAAFSTGPLEPESNGETGNRPLSTGDLISPYSAPSQPVAAPVPAPPPPPPPPFGNNNPYGTEPTVQAAPTFDNNPYGTEPTIPASPPPFAWSPNTAGEMPADPYSVNTVPSAAPVQSNLPPPPPFTGGSGVRLGQLDPNAPPVQNNQNLAAPPIFDPGAELRASLLPPTPVNAVPPPPGQVVVVRKRRRLNPLFLVLAAIIVLLLAVLIAFLLLQNKSPNPVAEVPAADQTATAAIALTATSTAQGTPGVTGAAKGTPGVAVGTAGSGTTGTGAANGTPGVASGTPGSAASGTPGAGGVTGASGTPGANGTAGAGPNGTGGTVQPGQPTPTAQGAGQPGNTTGTNTGAAPTPSSGTQPATGTGTNGTGGELPNKGTPTVVAGLGTDVPPPTVRDNRPPPEVVDYVNNTARYINNAQFFEAAIAEGIVKPYRAGRIKPGVTLINMRPISVPSSAISQIVPSGNLTATNGTGTTPGSTPSPTSAPAATATTAVTAGANGTPGATGGAASPTPTPRPSATAAATVGAGGSAPSNNPSNIPPGARQIVINGPNGPEVGYLVDFGGSFDMTRMTLALGQIARILKDQPVPAGGYELNQVSLEYANDLSNMANSMDMFFQSGKLSYLEDLANYYDKAVRDRDRWAQIVANGYPFRIIL